MKYIIKKGFIALAITVFLGACGSNSTQNNSADSGDSTSIGAGTDTTGSMVDTGSTVTDTTTK